MKAYLKFLAAVAAFAAAVAIHQLSDVFAEEETKKIPTATAMEVSPTAPVQPNKPVIKSEEEWKKELTAEQFRILRKAGTERPNGQVYKEFKAQGEGTYFCAGCGAELFSSKEKFDSHCGWPSFYDPSNAKNVKTSVDFLLGYPRTEVRCNVCDGHLGHVFEGEGFATPTDKRFCINGLVLKFVPKADPAKETKDGGAGDAAGEPQAGGADKADKADKAGTSQQRE